MRADVGGVAGVVVLVALASCKFERPPDVPGDGPPGDAGDDGGGGYTVGGSVAGMWDGAAVVLELTAPPAAPQMLTVSAVGTFTFPQGLPAGTSFIVGVASQPPLHDCAVSNPNGQVQAAPVTDISVSCTMTAAMSGAFSAPLSPAWSLDPAQAQYDFEAGAGVQESRLTVTAPAATSIRLGTTALTSGVRTSGPIAFPLGTSEPVLSLEFGAIHRQFMLVIDRSGGSSIIESKYGKASNTDLDDGFGVVAADGDLVAVGAPGEDSNATGIDQDQGDDSSIDSGAVYVFRRDGTSWTQEAYLKGSINASGARFGAAAAILNTGAGAILIVGAPGDGGGDGAAYVFRRSAAGTWSEQQRLTTFPVDTGANFGASVAISSRVGTPIVAVGAPVRGAAATGAAYVFRSDGAIWSQEKMLAPLDADPDEHFGEQVAIHGDLLAVSVPGDDSAQTGVAASPATDDVATDSGAVHLFRFGGTDWSLEAYVKASNTDGGDRFGSGLGLTSDVLVVGADGEDSDGSSEADDSGTDVGAAYVFRNVASVWSQEAYLKPALSMNDVAFGCSAAARGELLLIGAHEQLGQGTAGNAYLFVNQAGGWTREELSAPNPDLFDEFGRYVSLSGEGIIVGAPREAGSGTGFTGSQGDNTASGAGAFYAFY